jgi:hypothetical protein
MQSVHITTKVVSLNPAHGEVYSIQHYVIKFISDLLSVVSPGTLASFTNKTDSHNIAEIYKYKYKYKFYLKSEYKNIQHKLWRAFKTDIILLKVALNTMTLTLKHHSTNVGFLITVTMLEGILRKRKIKMEKKIIRYKF